MCFIPAIGMDFTPLLAYSNNSRVVSVQKNLEYDHVGETTTITGFRRRNLSEFKYAPERKNTKYRFSSEKREMEIDDTIDATIDKRVNNNLLRHLAAHLIYNEMLISDCLWGDVILSIALPKECFNFASIDDVRAHFFEGYQMTLTSKRIDDVFPNRQACLDGCECHVEAVDIVCRDDALGAICGSKGKHLEIIADYDKTRVYSFKNGELYKEEELFGLFEFCDNVPLDAISMYLDKGEKALELSRACDFYSGFLLEYIGSVGYIKPDHIHLWGTAADMIRDFGGGNRIPCAWHDANIVARTCSSITLSRYPYRMRAGFDMWKMYGGR